MHKKPKKPKGVPSSTGTTSAKLRIAVADKKSSKVNERDEATPSANPSSPNSKATKSKKVLLPSGKRDYNFLRTHLGTSAAAHLILEAITKIRQKTCNRHFAAFQVRQANQSSNDTELTQIREQWDQTLRVLRSHSGYNRVWNIGKPDEANALIDTVSDWFLREKAPQYEVEQRLMAFELATVPVNDILVSDSVESKASEPKRTSYLDAVSGSPPPQQGAESKVELSPEMKFLYALCTAHTRPIMTLRNMTIDEKKAMDLILEGKLEVPAVPPFLVNVLSKAYLAAFESIFESQTEYSIYGFLPLDFMLHRDCSYKKLVDLIENGRTKSGQFKGQIKAFLASTAKIVYTEQQ